jgi:amino acid adenylation domain-containing protein
MPGLLELIKANCRNDPTAAALGRPDGAFLDHTSLLCNVVAMGETLRSIGIERGDRIALSLPDALQAAVAFLAVATHSVCAPMNPRFRRAEIEFHLTDLSISALVVPEGEDPPALNVATRLGVQILRLACDKRGFPAALIADRIVQRCRKNRGVTNQALLLHTSGTTARPKIVPLSHANLVTSSRNIARSLALTPNDRCLNVMPLFHIHGLVGALLASLAAGSSVALPREFDPTCFFDWLDAGEATWYTAVPAIHQAVLAMAPRHAAVLARRHLRFVRSSSAALPPTVMAALERVFGTPVVEAYGMTEASHQIATNPLPPWVRKSGSVGLPAGPDVAILSEDGAFLPREAQGEICIRGETVMTAYEHNDDANAHAFRDGWLRTGDQGFLDADGYLHISGRLKEMINRGGEKVSPLEVEAVLLRHPAIAEAAVFSIPHPTLGEDAAAAVVLLPGATVAESNLRQWLQGYLADIKVPQQIIVVDALPRGPTGKVQRLLLADALQNRLCTAFVAPCTPTEQALAEIWREALGLERISVLDNFFSLGGDSLKAMMVISRLRRVLGVEVAVAALFARPVLAEFADAVREGARSTLPPIIAAGRDAPLPLSFAQQRMWFLAQMEGVSQAYHVPLGLRLTGELDDGALRRALDRLVARHEALRTTFGPADGQPVQRIAAENGGFSLHEHDLRQHGNAEGELQRLAIEEANAAFDLQAGPLVRGRLIRLGDSEHVLLITMHHIVSDGWSMGVLTRELGTLYRAYSQGQADPLPALAIQYPDYAVWQRRWLAGEVLQAQSDYWQRTLAGTPAVLELPTDRRRLPQQDHAGALVALELDDGLTAGLKALGQRHGTTLFMTLLTGWAALLARLSGQDDVVIGIPVANRGRAEVEPLIGFFVNTLALRIDLSGSPTVDGLLARVKARTLEAQQHQDLPFEHVVEIVRPPRNLAHAPVFQVMFAWQNTGESGLELPGLTVAPVRTPRCFAKFDLTLSLAEVGGRIVGGLEYATALFDRATVERHAEYLRRVLAAMVADAQQAVDRMALLGAAERHQLLTLWNATEAAYPRDRCIHELFEAQAARAPDAVAVVHGDRQLSYGELNARANRLAHHLRGFGVTPDARVAICVERGPDMLIGLLAILKAGGAYVPLDPKAPSKRLQAILEDAQPKVIMVQSKLQKAAIDSMTSAERKWIGDPPIIICLEQDAKAISAESAENASSGATSDSLAYVCFTSGSTGGPKGVSIPHRGVVRLVKNTNYVVISTSDVFLQFAPVSFDASTFEIWGCLLNGARLVVCPPGMLSLAELGSTIRAHGISVLWLTAGLFHQMVDEELDSLKGVRQLLTGGDVLSVAHVRKALDALGEGRLINGYGPTENTTFTCCHAITRSSLKGHSVPIGRPISNTQCFVLDRSSQPAPIGVRGELFVGGDGLARGYLNDPELTAEKFIPNPLRPGALLYRTGDFARYLPDGNIEFLGRVDHQVKIRGFRIELGEIEARLAQHPAVREAVVPVGEDGSGDKRLVAYYTVVPDAAAADAEALRRHLSAVLPEYMVPAAYVQLDALPLTVNGKLDRRALPEPKDLLTESRASYVAPRSATEQVLADIWSEILGSKQVGIADNFFELGGHSLAVVRLISEVNRTLKIGLSVPEVFQNVTVEQLARVIDARRPMSKRLPTVIQLREGRIDPPVYFIYAGPDEFSLAQMVATGQPVYGIEVPYPLAWRKAAENFDISALPTMAQLVAPYVATLRTHAGSSPCVLAGFSFAGVMAFEVAEQLQEQGGEVEAVLLFDSWATFPHQIAWCNLRKDWMQAFNAVSTDHSLHSFGLHVKRSGVLFGGILKTKIRFFLTETKYLFPLYKLLRSLFRRSAIYDSLTSIQDEQGMLMPMRLLGRLYDKALKTKDQRCLDLRGVLFGASSGEKKILRSVDSSLGWANLFTRGLAIIPVPGDHLTMIREKSHRLALCRKMNEALSRLCSQLNKQSLRDERRR